MTQNGFQTDSFEKKPLLLCNAVTATFGSLVAVDRLDFQVLAGETVGIGGPNGAGKTTLLDLISGLQPLSGGSIKFQGDRIDGKSPPQICHAGVARTFQLNAGFDQLSVLDNVLTATVFGSKNNQRSRGLFYSKLDLEQSKSMLEEFGLYDKADELVENISILDRKKLMLATALTTDPDLLLLDEPVGGLNPAEIDQFIELINQLKDTGLSIIFIEHVMRFLTAIATRAMIMHHGSKLYDGDPQGIARDEAVTEVYLGASAELMRSSNPG